MVQVNKKKQDAVCKSWCPVVSDPGFSRRFRRTPSMLGVFCNSSVVVGRRGRETRRVAARFVPTSSAASSSPPVTDRRGFRVVDARHGRALLHDDTHTRASQLDGPVLVVWDPFADEQRALPKLHRPPYRRQSETWTTWNAAVLRPSSATRGRDDDGSLRLEPFLVGIIRGAAHLCSYSSGAVAWSEPIRSSLFIKCHDDFVVGPSLLLGDVLHFVVGRQILRYDYLRGHFLSTITSPFVNALDIGLVTVEKEKGAGAHGYGYGYSISQGVAAAHGSNSAWELLPPPMAATSTCGWTMASGVGCTAGSSGCWI
ncbi:hypothetical protein QOZ80_6AG0541440 [Eleusine coracana subsp. coracana]|nr:hypothetical protein QOZ80_6AG0541440 [Eleusine coracana subsp. coracana]